MSPGSHASPPSTAGKYIRSGCSARPSPPPQHVPRATRHSSGNGKGNGSGSGNGNHGNHGNNGGSSDGRSQGDFVHRARLCSCRLLGHPDTSPSPNPSSSLRPLRLLPGPPPRARTSSQRRAMADREPDHGASQPPSPRTARRPPSMRRSHFSGEPDERSPLLTVSTKSRVRIRSGANSPRPSHLSRNQSYAGNSALFLPGRPLAADPNPGRAPGPRHHSCHGSWSSRLITALSERRGSAVDSILPDERVWYDQFTSTDWVHDTIADSHRVKALRSRQDLWGRVRVLFDGIQGWILSALSGLSLPSSHTRSTWPRPRSLITRMAIVPGHGI